MIHRRFALRSREVSRSVIHRRFAFRFRGRSASLARRVRETPVALFASTPIAGERHPERVVPRPFPRRIHRAARVRRRARRTPLPNLPSSPAQAPRASSRPSSGKARASAAGIALALAPARARALFPSPDRQTVGCSRPTRQDDLPVRDPIGEKRSVERRPRGGAGAFARRTRPRRRRG